MIMLGSIQARELTSTRHWGACTQGTPSIIASAGAQNTVFQPLAAH